MIKYQLLCDADHEFEGWFRDSADYDVQSENALIECPACGSDVVRKAVMAPAISRRSGRPRDMRQAEVRRDMSKAVERARNYVEKNFDYVGEKFPEEARKIHYGEEKDRNIFGEATGKEVREMIDEGVRIAPLPGASKPGAKKAGAKKADRAGKPVVSPASQKKLN